MMKLVGVVAVVLIIGFAMIPNFKQHFLQTGDDVGRVLNEKSSDQHKEKQ